MLLLQTHTGQFKENLLISYVKDSITSGNGSFSVCHTNFPPPTPVMSGIGSRKGGECYLLDTGKVHSSEALYIPERKIPLVPSLFL